MVDPTSNLLLRKQPPRISTLELWPGIHLTLGRVHEACGPNRRSLAMIIAKKTEGPIFWISPEWSTDHLHADGIISFINPGRLTFITPKRAEDILWLVEEVLRSGVVPLVVADLPGIPALTPVRRLHLAAEVGLAEGMSPPLALLLTPGDGGAPGVESRWRLAARHQGPNEIWKIDRIRSRSEPLCSWQMSHQAGGYALCPLSSIDPVI